MRINKLIAGRLGISRRKADEFIEKDRVLVNGILPSPGMDVTDPSTVLVDKKPLPEEKKTITILLNKPEGYVCSRDGQGSHTVYELLPSELRFTNIVGRLDKDSSGLLLFTNDGELHNDLTHPSKDKEKTYHVTLNKKISENDLEILSKKGVPLRDGISRFIILNLDTDSFLYEVTLREGRNRQIRRTFNAMGYKITALQRTAVGAFSLSELKPGEYKIV